tara:strand:- start:182 stop:631 length:450 start_codon:yes stop_codon:yes gene_type:complete
MKRYFAFIVIIFFLQNISYAIDENKYNTIIENLRCLVCQNQSLSESDSNLAKDLRLKVKTMLGSGKTEEEIYKFMSDRYTDYVLYNPPLKKSTWFLWYSPFIILIISLVYLYFNFHRNKKSYTKVDESDAKNFVKTSLSTNTINIKKYI